MAPNKGNGKTIKWLRAHAGHEGDDCLIWPFSKSNGYGMFGYLGELHYAHRFMCELAHGPSPEGYDASHSCGNGHKGCCNPRHVSWKSKSDNQYDRAHHGTKNTWGPRGKLTPQIAEQIKALKGTAPQRVLAARFGVSRSNISNIQCGRQWPVETRKRQWRGAH